jgi:hypothetical protein
VTSWLKRIGIVIADGLKVAEVADPGLAPIASPLVNLLDRSTGNTSAVKMTDTMDELARYVVDAETMFATLYPQGGAGANKLAAITPLALQAMLQSPIAQGKKLANPAAAKAASGAIAGGLADFLNAFE